MFSYGLFVLAALQCVSVHTHLTESLCTVKKHAECLYFEATSMEWISAAEITRHKANLMVFKVSAAAAVSLQHQL